MPEAVWLNLQLQSYALALAEFAAEIDSIFGFGYDANKPPLGKLSKDHVKKAYEKVSRHAYCDFALHLERSIQTECLAVLNLAAVTVCQR